MFKNVFNDYYVKDISNKTRSALAARLASIRVMARKLIPLAVMVKMRRTMGAVSYADNQGFTNCREYYDDNISGTTFARPQFMKMLADIEAGSIDTVLFDMSLT